MLTVEVLAQRDLDAAASHALDLYAMRMAAEQRGRAGLRVYALAGDVVSLGRYHLAPPAHAATRVGLHRRLSGGRVVPLGPGFAVLSLTLPHRSALVADDPLALRPEQTLNRCTRAVLAGLRGLGVDAFYPGRDRITLDRRLLGIVGLESDSQGVTRFEAVLAIDGEWLSVPRRLAEVDRQGGIAAEILDAGQVTTLAAHGVRPSIDELAHCIAASYAQQFGLELAAGEVPAEPPGAVSEAAAWVASRRPRSELDRHAVGWGQLGVIEVHLAVHAGTIADVMVSGDFIADSPSIAVLEQRLRGCALTRAALGAVVDAVYAEPRSFLLGIGPLSTLVDTILRAA